MVDFCGLSHLEVHAYGQSMYSWQFVIADVQ